jgi:hypothetical protein
MDRFVATKKISPSRGRTRGPKGIFSKTEIGIIYRGSKNVTSVCADNGSLTVIPNDAPHCRQLRTYDDGPCGSGNSADCTESPLRPETKRNADALGVGTVPHPLIVCGRNPHAFPRVGVQPVTYAHISSTCWGGHPIVLPCDRPVVAMRKKRGRSGGFQAGGPPLLPTGKRDYLSKSRNVTSAGTNRGSRRRYFQIPSMNSSPSSSCLR